MERNRPAEPLPIDPSLHRRIEGLLEAHKVPGAAIAVIRNRRIVAEQGFGRTERGPSNPVDTEAVFQAASLSKPVFAYTVLFLSTLGRLDLDTPLTRYLPPPYLHEQEPWKARALTQTDLLEDSRLQRVTAKMVLEHVAGFPNWARHDPLAFQFDPGEKWSYSSEGYVYLQRVVEHITGKPLNSTVREMVFQPLDMQASSFVDPHSRWMAAGHDKQGELAKTDSWTRPLASTSLYTSLRDYALFVEHLLSTPDGRASLAAATERTVPVDDGLGLSWGLGWGVEEFAGQRYFFHWGANTGFRSFVLGSVDGREGIVILTNGENGLDLSADLVELLLRERHPLFSFYLLHPT
jgi:CubicO group peptidase (beta-lactamase class C family)